MKAINFEVFVLRHGESATQVLIERMERYEGAQPDVEASLESRWANLMQACNSIAA